MRSTALLIVLMLALMPLPSEASNVGDSLTVGIQSVKTDVFRPFDPQERDILSVYALIYDSLLVINDDYYVEPSLAESWSHDASGRTWTFNLRSNVTFSDGTPLTARDVVASAQAILNRANDEFASSPGFYHTLNYCVAKVSAKDDLTVVVKTKTDRSYYGILYAMTFPVVPAAEVDADFPLGSGPYVLTGFSPGSYISLEANLNWWKSIPQVRYINFTCHETQNQVIESYEFARVKTVFTRSIAASQYKSGSNSLSMDSRTRQLEVLLMNQSYSKLASRNVRLAIRMTIDVNKIANNVYMGMVEQTNMPVYPGTWLYDETVDPSFVHDVSQAKILLAEDGWMDSDEDGVLDKLTESGEKLSLTLRLYVYEEPDNDVRYETAIMIASQLAEIGISVEIITTNYVDIQEKLKAGSFHLALCAFEMDAVPDPGFLLTTSNTGNYGRYRSPTMDDLFKELRTTCIKPDQYKNTLYKIEHLIAEDCPFICLFYRSGTVLTRLMYTTVRDVREYELLRGIESFRP